MKIYENFRIIDNDATKFPFCVHVKIQEISNNTIDTFVFAQFKCGHNIYFKVSNPIYLIHGNCYLIYVSNKQDIITYTIVYNTTTKTIIDNQLFNKIIKGMHMKHDMSVVDVGLYYAPYVPLTIGNTVQSTTKINYDNS